MYRVYLDGNMIYEPGSTDLIILDPKLELELNSPGQFTFTLPNGHPYYDAPRKMLSRVEVYRNDEMLFRGRILDDSQDFYKRKTLVCEGELGYLNDSIQRPAEYHDVTVRGYLEALIASHNEQVEEDKQFAVGVVAVQDSNDSLYRYTNNNSTLTEIKEDLIDDLGGYLRVRYSGGVRYLDYVNLVDYGITNDDAIRFGRNLLDFTQDADATNIATVIIPLGQRLEESPIEALDMRLTIEEVNDGKDWIQSDEAVETYGRIVKTVIWDDVSLPENLLSKGERYLSDTQWDTVELSASAVDMNLTDAEMDAFHLGDQLRVVSDPHGLDRYFPLSKMTLYLNKPESNSYTLGLSTQASLIGQLVTQGDLSSRLGNLSARLASITGEKINNSSSEVLQEAKDNATQLITSATTDMQAYSDALNEATSKYAEALAEGNAELAEQYYKEMQALNEATSRYAEALAEGNAELAEQYYKEMQALNEATTKYAEALAEGNTELAEQYYKEMLEYAEKLVASATACGHVVIEAPYNEILIMDTEDKNTALRVWRWNLNGLGYSNTGYNGEFGLAMTMDGSIVADYITTGIMNADLIRTGRISGLSTGENYWDLDSGEFSMTKGSIELGDNFMATSGGAIYAYHPHFVFGISMSDTIGTGIGDSGYGFLAMNAGNVLMIGDTDNFALDVFSNSSIWLMTSNEETIWLWDPSVVSSSLSVWGSFSTMGTKSRIVETKDYDDISFYSFETPSPMFADIGSGVVGDNGETAIFFDPEFAESIDMNCEYQVVLTQTSPKHIEYTDKQSGYFTVYGEAGATFDWEVIARQRDYTQTRYEQYEKEEQGVYFDEKLFANDNDAVMETINMVEQYEQEVELL